jgi:hypothetical protein
MYVYININNNIYLNHNNFNHYLNLLFNSGNIYGNTDIDINSYTNNLNAYGIVILLVSEFLHYLHMYISFLICLCANLPQSLHTHISYLSDESNNFSFKKYDIPCAIIQSLSISPHLNPPSFALPSGAYLVNIYCGPLAL